MHDDLPSLAPAFAIVAGLHLALAAGLYAWLWALCAVPVPL